MYVVSWLDRDGVRQETRVPSIHDAEREAGERKAQGFGGVEVVWEFDPDGERDSTQEEVLIQALEACSRKDCAHCLYQGKGIKCRERLMLDAAQALGKNLPNT